MTRTPCTANAIWAWTRSPGGCGGFNISPLTDRAKPGSLSEPRESAFPLRPSLHTSREATENICRGPSKEGFTALLSGQPSLTSSHSQTLPMPWFLINSQKVRSGGPRVSLRDSQWVGAGLLPGPALCKQLTGQDKTSRH